MGSNNKKLNPDWIVSAEELTDWMKVKDETRPCLTGSQNWHKYVDFLEAKLVKYGVVDVTKNRWPFDRWYTSDDDSKWSFISDGKPVRVAHYGAYSGTTGPVGNTAEMIYYDHENPPDVIEGKIVVIPTLPHPENPDDEYLKFSTFNDYEYRTDEPFAPLYEWVDPEISISFDTMYQLQQQYHEMAIAGGAVGMVIIYDMAYERSVGLYTFPVPTLHDMPWLTLAREDGAQVIEDAKAGKTATLRLEASIEPSEAVQTICYLPGKDYGTSADEQILLTNHTDGVSITQDNGAIGLLAIVKYYSQIPQAERNRSLTVYLDCRHYIPGMEAAHREASWFTRYPARIEPIVSMIQMEHIGERDWREVNGRIEPIDLPEQSYLWCRNNQQLIDEGIRAVKEHGWKRAQVVCPERPGIHGGFQQWWWGVGVVCLPTNVIVTINGEEKRSTVPAMGVPGYGLGGFLGYYWTTDSGLDRWDCDNSLAQIKTMTQLTGVLMNADLDEIS
ncbi:MAG: hypothetical protein AAF490_20105 [Chloroflexota bacterium]